MILQFLASYFHLAILLLQLTFVLNKNKFFQGFHLSTLYTFIIYYYTYYYHNLNNNDNYLKGALHLLPKINTFCALSQNNRQLFENKSIHQIVQGTQKWHYNLSRQIGI